MVVGALHLLEGDAGEVVAFDFPPGHVLVAAGDELGGVVGVELDGEDGEGPRVPEGQRPVLLPVEQLQRERLVHPHRQQQVPIPRKAQMQNPSLVRRLQDHQRLQSVRIPNVDGGVDVDLSGGDDGLEGVPSDGGDLQRVALVERLLVLGGVVQHPEPRREVRKELRTDLVLLVVFYVHLGLFEDFVVVGAEDLGEDHVEFGAGRASDA
mmetsp:Transcript_34024/g.33186  ORF Transcript_34024/g.33186 Transcript_34024/m.33186 type:complete len:209 (+) Transcript_34024:732-1358(+)